MKGYKRALPFRWMQKSKILCHPSESGASTIRVLAYDLFRLGYKKEILDRVGIRISKSRYIVIEYMLLHSEYSFVSVKYDLHKLKFEH